MRREDLGGGLVMTAGFIALYVVIMGSIYGWWR